MESNRRFTRKLGGWDAIALLLGAGVSVSVQLLRPDWLRDSLFWFAAPAIAIAARQRFLPQLDPPPRAPDAPPVTRVGKVVGYAMMIFGGLVMLFAGIFLGIEMQERAVGAMVGGIAVFAVAGLVASGGFRRVG